LEGKEARQVGGQGMQARWSRAEMHATQAAKARQIGQAMFGGKANRHGRQVKALEADKAWQVLQVRRLGRQARESSTGQENAR
jgi:hypothetical protein